MSSEKARVIIRVHHGAIEDLYPVLQALKRPSTVLKYGRKGKPHKRTFYISKDEFRLHWVSSKKSADRSYVEFDEVIELRSGRDTDTFRRFPVAQQREQLSFSLIYHNREGKLRTLDLECKDTQEYDEWVGALHYLLMKTDDPETRYVKREWKRADKDRSGTLDFNEISGLLQRINLKMNKKYIKAVFDKFDVDNNKTLDFDEFSQFLRYLRERPEVNRLFHEYSATKQLLMPEELVRFIHMQQGDQLRTVDQAKEIIKTHAKNYDGLTIFGFHEWLRSQENDVMKVKHRGVYQDMLQPLTHYFIDSSHNTYLTGDQLKSDSSVEMYIKSLKDGCRCVELDCWDGKDGNPIIYHGHTLTSKIKFRDVVQAINDFSFVTSEYPVILSLENHCSIAQQEIMAEMMITIFGDYLALPLQPGEPMPSPFDLRFKILLKGKRLPPNATSDEVLASDDEDDDDDEEEKKSSKKKEKKKKKVKIAQALSDITFLHAVHFHNWEESAASAEEWQMSSFSETKTLKLLDKAPTEFIGYNKRQLSRIYPKGVRVDSSNYEPVPAWNCGCQIVALNYQTPDPPMWHNNGLFADNGKSGYVLKPEELRSRDAVFDPNKPPSSKLRVLKLKIISGQQIPKPGGEQKGEIIDPYVVIEVLGLPCDATKTKTRTIDDNGFNPRWEENFSFPIVFPELALLKFTVYDEDKMSADDYIAHRVIRVTSLNTGYRHVKLLDENDQEMEHASLFVHIAFENPSVVR